MIIEHEFNSDELLPVTAADGRPIVRVTVKYKDKREKLGSGVRREGKYINLYERVKQRRLKNVKKIVAHKKEGLETIRDISVLGELKNVSAIQMEIPKSYIPVLNADYDIEEVIEDGTMRILGCMEDYNDDRYRVGWDYMHTEWPSWAWLFQNNGEVADQIGAGEGVKVMIMDTGICWDHPDLIDKVDMDMLYWDCPGSPDIWWDDHGHGTHCAGIVAANAYNNKGTRGVANKCILHSCKVLDYAGAGTWISTERVLDYCLGITDNLDVISMSFGGHYTGTVLPALFLQLKNAGIVCCASAGNNGNEQGTGCNVGYPGSDPSTIGVAALGPHRGDSTACDERAWFSSTGDEVDFAAPGASIWSTLGGSNQGGLGTSSVGNGYACWSGTSMSCPFVAGVFAVLRGNFPGYSVDQLISIAKYTCLNRTDDYQARHPNPNSAYIDKDPWYGWGIIKLDLYRRAYSLNTEIEVAKPYKYTAKIGTAPTWELPVDYRVGKADVWSYHTDYPDNWKLHSDIKVRRDARWNFTTKINPNWVLPVHIEAKKPYTLSFTVVSDIEDINKYEPEIEFVLPAKDYPLRTLFLDYVTAAGSPYIYDFEMWWARHFQRGTITGVCLYAEVIADTNEAGKEIIEEGWIEARIKNESWATLNTTNHLQIGQFGCDTFKDIQLRINVPVGHTTSGSTFVRLKVAGICDQAFHGAGVLYNDGVLYSDRDVITTKSFICRLYVI